MITVKNAASHLGQSVEAVRLALSAIRPDDWDSCREITAHEFEELSKLLQPPALPQSQPTQIQPTQSQPTQSQPTQPTTSLDFLSRSLHSEIEMIEAAGRLKNRLALEILSSSDAELAEALNVRHLESKSAYLAVLGDLASLKPEPRTLTPDSIDLGLELKKFQ